MRIIETAKLYDIAAREGIIIEQWDFPEPLDAIYYFEPGLPPSIGISNRFNYESPYYRCVLAEELGHHFTTSGNYISNQNMIYRERLSVSKVEYKAMKWAAETLIPIKLLRQALYDCNWSNWAMAEYFEVTLDMFEFRLQLPDVSDLLFFSQFKRLG